MKASYGRLVMAFGAAAVLVTGAFVIVGWRDVLAFYRSFRLDRALTAEEAAPFLREIIDDAQTSDGSRRLVEKLGPRSQGLTFWLFEETQILRMHQRKGFVGDERLRSVLSDLGRRLERDDELMGCWVQYLRWRQDGWMKECLDELEEPLHTVSRFDVGAGRHPLGTFAITGSWDPASTQLEILKLQAVLWFIGLPGAATAPQEIFNAENISFEVEVGFHVVNWLNAHWRKASFDPALGRVVVEDGATRLGLLRLSAGRIPQPDAPFIRWRGPVPTVPNLR